MKALILTLAVPPWLALTSKIIVGVIVVVVFFIFCLVRANINEHEKKDDTIDPGDF